MRALPWCGVVLLLAAALPGCGSGQKSGSPGSGPGGVVGGKPAPAIQALEAEFLVPRDPKNPFPKPATAPVAFFSAAGTKVQNLAPMQGHEDAVSDLAFTPDGAFLVSASYGDYSLRTWSLGGGKQVSKQKMERRPSGLAIAPDGQAVVTVDVYEHLVFWPLDASGRLGAGAQIEAKVGRNPEIAISPNGRLLAVSSFDKRLTLWDFKTREKIRTVETEEGLRGVAFSPDGKLLAAGTTTNFFILWDLESGIGKKIVVPRVGPETETSQVCFSRDGSLFSTAHNQPYLTVWECPGMKYRHYVNGPMSGLMASTFSPDGKVLASAWGDKKMYLWSPSESQQPLAVLEGHQALANCMAFSPDGTVLATGGDDKQIFIWYAERPRKAAAKLPDQRDPRIFAAQEAFVLLFRAAGQGNLEVAKKYVTRNKWKEMEAKNEIATMLKALTQVGDLQGRIEGNKVVLSQTLVEGSGTGQLSISIQMVEEDGQWKVGE